jgi:AcrR family transcriptional regulator
MRGRRQQILDAALAIADSDGLGKVSMRTVAEDVGVTPMALYRHFDSKVALLDGMVERLVTSLRPEQVTGSWDERLTALAHGYRSLAQRHPWSADLLFSRPSVTPDAARVTEFICAAIREAGAPESQVGRRPPGYHLCHRFLRVGGTGPVRRPAGRLRCRVRRRPGRPEAADQGGRRPEDLTGQLR